MKKNKEWLKEQINYLKEAVGKPAINDFSRGLNDAYDTLESLIDQLDEPEKVVIPKFVADWIEFCKKNEASLAECLTAMNIDHQRAFYWLNSNRSDMEEIVARAWLDGYTIEKPKLLTVIVKSYDKTIMTKQMP